MKVGEFWGAAIITKIVSIRVELTAIAGDRFVNI